MPGIDSFVRSPEYVFQLHFQIFYTQIFCHYNSIITIKKFIGTMVIQ